MSPSLPLKDFRCACGKLLFRGLLSLCVVEIKCRRCGNTKVFEDNKGAEYALTFVVEGDGRISDACEGLAIMGYERRYFIGQSLSDLFPSMYDAPIQTQALSNTTPYHIPHHTLLLRDGKTLHVESFIVPKKEEERVCYRMINVVNGK